MLKTHSILYCIQSDLTVLFVMSKFHPPMFIVITDKLGLCRPDSSCFICFSLYFILCCLTTGLFTTFSVPIRPISPLTVLT